MATYYRCMFSAILPDDVEKVLYLDCDIVVLGDISEFWNTDLSGCGAACIEDIGNSNSRNNCDKSIIRKSPQPIPYCSALLPSAT